MLNIACFVLGSKSNMPITYNDGKFISNIPSLDFDGRDRGIDIGTMYFFKLMDFGHSKDYWPALTNHYFATVTCT